MRRPLEIREQMREVDIETVLECAQEAFPTARPTIVADNGPQFIARISRSSSASPGCSTSRRRLTIPSRSPPDRRQIERWHATIKGEAIRPGTPFSVEDARPVVERFVCQSNNVRLHSAIGYVAPRSRLKGKFAAIQAARDAKLEASRATAAAQACA